MNYFAIFNLPVCYHVNKQILVSRFQDLQRQYHPDKFINSTKEERLAALSHSATINRAWQTLRNPITRAEHFLVLQGFLRNKNGCHTVQDTVFLLEQLKLREELDKIKYDRDTILLERFIKKIEKMFDSSHYQLAKHLKNEAWETAINTVYRLRFLKKLLDSSELLEEELLNF